MESRSCINEKPCQPLLVNAAIRSKVNSTSPLALPAAALTNVERDGSERSVNAAGAHMDKPAHPPELIPVFNTGKRTAVHFRGADPARSNHRTVPSWTPQPCRTSDCRKALAECTKLCDTAMIMGVAACSRLASGASARDEKDCLARRDRRQRDCHSGCALRQLRTSQAE